ncbi:creatininase family protein [Halocatena pleomorpha]|uniref:Creatininase family protein n=1 Tax=Halocatena pleomorpha TaxID=1785090 RepID=A0A3P3R4N7_9EURY|nr:creatininase family protein [Halocatena pleomorpha]RRJ28432.1 creatininase family protein [Halocatena pleomorpha]
MQLSESTWTDVENADTDLALLPVGSTEQHGPHAPLGTDTVIASAVAETADERYDGDVVVGPTVPVGIAEEHRHFTGTLWVTEETFRRYVRETIESLIHHGFNRVIVVNGHGGNVDALRECCATISRHEAAYAVPFTWFEAVSGRMGHGGTLETSLISHLRSELIRDDRLAEATENGTDHWGEWQSGTNLAYDSAEFTENGVVGDPSRGDGTLGAELLDEAAAALVELIETVSARGLTPPERW